MNLRQKILTDGYLILENVFNKNELEKYKNDILSYAKKNKGLTGSGGISIPNFINIPQLEHINELKNNKKIKEALDNIFDGTNYRFCSHNDIGINKIAGWHKDKLNSAYAKYETIPIWSEFNREKHEIVKVLIYLQDHSNNDSGLQVVPKSHLISKIDTKNSIQLRPQLGDVIIFDQRITHRGMEKQISSPRIMICFGFGKNNIFTDNFEKGTIARQNEQNKKIATSGITLDSININI